MTQEILDDAVRYVADNLDYDDRQISYVADHMLIHHRSLANVDYRLSDKIVDLMDEYFNENDIADDWRDYLTDEDIILKINLKN